MYTYINGVGARRKVRQGPLHRFSLIESVLAGEREHQRHPLMVDTGPAYMCTLDLPGLTHDDVTITVTATGFRLQAARLMTIPDGVTAHQRERRTFRVDRSYRFPVNVDPDSVEATFVRGVLTVTFPKSSEARPRRVEITT